MDNTNKWDTLKYEFLIFKSRREKVKKSLKQQNNTLM